MSEATNIACPQCGKQYRWKAELAGKKVRCRCGEKFRIAEPSPAAAADTYELSAGSGAGSPLADVLPRQSDQARSTERRCPNCNTKISDQAVICINCGTDTRTGEKTRVAQGEVAVAGNPGAPAGLKIVQAGLLLILLAVVLRVLLLVAPIGAIWLGEEILIFVIIGAYAISGIQTLGTLLCLAAPKESGGRLVLAISILLSLGSGVANFLIESEILPPILGVLTNLMSFASTICFLAFFVQLARYLAFDEITQQAEKLLAVYVILLVALLGVFIPFVGCFIGLFVLGWGIYAAILYIILLVDLNNAVGYRIKEAT